MSWLVQPEDPELPHSWRESDRFIPRVVVRPAQDFLPAESAGAVVMLVAAVAAPGLGQHTVRRFLPLPVGDPGRGWREVAACSRDR